MSDTTPDLPAMSDHILTASAERDHTDHRRLMDLRPSLCHPGVSIEVSYHPGWSAASLTALDAAYQDVRAQLANAMDRQ